jgi:hypothetical protein
MQSYESWLVLEWDKKKNRINSDCTNPEYQDLSALLRWLPPVEESTHHNVNIETTRPVIATISLTHQLISVEFANKGM